MRKFLTFLGLLVAVVFFTLSCGQRSNDSQLGTTSVNEPTPQDIEYIDSLFTSYTGKRPGAAVGIYKDGKVFYEKGYGLGNIPANETIAPHSNFRLASVTKAFTAFAIMILKERGKLNYDMSLKDVFPEFPDYGKKVTIRHLLHHTGGLQSYETLMDQYETPRPIKDRDILKLLVEHTTSTEFTPGSTYSYSNTGYCILGQVVERISGKRFSEFLKQEIFTPLAMSNTVAFEKGINVIPNRVFGYDASGNDSDQSDTSSTLGDGGVYTSVHEMFLWDQALYSNKIIRNDTLKDAFVSGRLNDGSATNYGFGWRLDTDNGHKLISHTGGTCGFLTIIQRYPDDKLAVVVLTNRNSGSPSSIAAEISEYMLKGPQSL